MSINAIDILTNAELAMRRELLVGLLGQELYDAQLASWRPTLEEVHVEFVDLCREHGRREPTRVESVLSVARRASMTGQHDKEVLLLGMALDFAKHAEPPPTSPPPVGWVPWKLVPGKAWEPAHNQWAPQRPWIGGQAPTPPAWRVHHLYPDQQREVAFVADAEGVLSPDDPVDTTLFEFRWVAKDMLTDEQRQDALAAPLEYRDHLSGLEYVPVCFRVA